MTSTHRSLTALRMTRLRWTADALVGFAVLAGTLLMPFAGDVPAIVRFPSGIIIAAAITVRRAHPAVALALAWAAAAVQMMTFTDVTLAQVGTGIVLYSAVVYGSRRLVWMAAASVGGGVLIGVPYLLLTHSWTSTLIMDGPWYAAPIGTTVSTLVVLGGSWLLGIAVRAVHAARDQETQRVVAERETAAAREIAALQAEKAELARDVHDVIGHSLAVIIAQSDAVRFLPDEDTGSIKRGVAVIAETARSSLGEVRAVLQRIAAEQNEIDLHTPTRATAATAQEGPGSAQTEPRFSDVPALIERLGRSGVVVDRTDVGAVLDLHPEQQRVAFRVVQEMLTNALKHGQRGEPIRLEIVWGEEALVLRVENRPRLAPRAGERLPVTPGNGIVGMRARLADLGGSLELTGPLELSGPLKLRGTDNHDTATPSRALFCATARIPYHSGTLSAGALP